MAMMTATEMVEFVYTMIKDGPLGREIGGEVYPDDERPPNSREEDVVISFLNGMNGQLQTGVVIINVYIPDCYKSSGRMVKYKDRVKQIEKIANEIPSTMNGCSPMFFWIEGTPNTKKFDDIKQHAVTIRLNFKLITD